MFLSLYLTVYLTLCTVHIELCSEFYSAQSWQCTAVAVGVIQWRGLDHIPGSGDIWGLVISHKTGVDKHFKGLVFTFYLLNTGWV